MEWRTIPGEVEPAAHQLLEAAVSNPILVFACRGSGAAFPTF